jgi:hypothetical protein
MHHRVGAVIDEQLRDGSVVVNLRPHERDSPGHRLFMALGQIVEHGHVVAGVDKGADGMTADIAGASSDNDAGHAYERPMQK